MATVYYNSSASGSNDGTSEANAYTDLQTALNSLSAGDHLYVKRDMLLAEKVSRLQTLHSLPVQVRGVILQS